MAQRDVARSTELSGSVPGLNPGFEVVLLGFCRSGESAVQRRLLKAYHPFIYELPVTQAVSACPKWKEAGGERVLQEPAMVKVGLSGVTLTRVVSRLQPPVSLGDGRVVLWLDVVARDAAGKYLGKVSMEHEHSPTGMGMEGCDTTLEPSRKTAFVVTRRCTYVAGAACNFLPSDTTRTVVKWDGQKLVEEDKVIEKREVELRQGLRRVARGLTSTGDDDGCQGADDCRHQATRGDPGEGARQLIEIRRAVRPLGATRAWHVGCSGEGHRRNDPSAALRRSLPCPPASVRS
ncbi:hypothetical protein [Myxococcus sp. AB025B]|uniref:hypothetical protein n=1 Tax=Myxococcus sp. AB025B TaxID=2562794 RepID=UPI0011439B59|nr:hypothetical protein [Myxococcus sp. AB025B]